MKTRPSWWTDLSFHTKNTPAPARKGAIRINAIPSSVLARLNKGQEETRTLVEWLAVDQKILFRTVCGQLDIPINPEQKRTSEAAGKEKITRKTQIFGQIWREILEKHPHSHKIFEILSFHESDLVRAWAISALRAEPKIPFSTRLRYMKIFSADRNMGVRETAWDGFRPFIQENLDGALADLEKWVYDKNDAVRRCAIEGTRPRGVWTAHLEALKENPDLALPLLEPVKSDSSLYVRKAVANWLNDASKSRPAWVLSLVKRWRRQSKTKETEWIAQRGLRTINKK